MRNEPGYTKPLDFARATIFSIVFSTILKFLTFSCIFIKTASRISAHSSIVYALQYIVSSTLEKLYAFNVSEEVLRKLQEVMKRYLDIYVEKHR